MERLKYITIILLVAAISIPAFADKPATVLLQEGLYAEEVDGDLDAAIKSYGQIIKDGTAQRSHVAMALYRQGMCYLKKGDEMRAGAAFEKLVSNFGDQTKIMEKVKPMLKELGNGDPAALMPPNTLVYVELGSPGRQIETILNMLKGTPFANPLAVIGGGRSEKTPGDIMAALFNPSMMAEFKKIRGMAVGITGISQNNPPGVAVLYPGKSDALRGMLLAGLGMIAQPGEPIEGMSTLMFGHEGGIAYDDKVIIISHPVEQLKWSVKQYKGITKEPTLASSNKSFAKISKKARMENALTIWSNADEVYSGVLKQIPKDHIPKEMLMADGIIDIKSIDDVISFFSLKESGIAAETNISFKKGHHSLAYDMIRTPNLSKKGFEAVPSDAIALVSVALGEADSAQAKAISKKIDNITGLDIGREIFANIEQITLFALPPDGDSSQNKTGLPPLANCIGVAITSHNPKQTHQILTQLLGVANLMLSKSEAKQPTEGIGKYVIGLANDQKIYCYMTQAGNTTVLSLNSDVVENSISAINGSKSILAGGPLKETVSNLSPTTSKLVMVNVGGALRLAESNINLGPKDAENSPHQLIAKLAKSCDKTVVQLRTDEKLNSFSAGVNVSGLPPVNDVFGVVMQLTEGLSKGKSEAKAWKKEAKGPSAIIAKTNQAPAIDGKAEGLWASAKDIKLTNAIYSSMPSKEDLSANYKVMYDENNLYMLVDVTDDKLVRDSGSDEWYFDDCVEIFIDADNSKSGGYDDNDAQYHFNWDKSNPMMNSFQHGEVDNVKFAMVRTENGYRTEIKFPWSTLRVKPSKVSKIGLDVHVNDDDDGGDRDTKITWSDKEDIAFQSPSVFGTLMRPTENLSKGKPEAKAWKKETKDSSALIAKKTNQAPVIDGKAEGLWASAKDIKLANAIYSSMPSEEDLSADFRIMCDNDNLYVFVDVIDDKLVNDSGPDEWYLDDCVEIFVDADNSKSESYDDNDGQYRFSWNPNRPTMNMSQGGGTEGIEFAMVTTEKGYRTEIKFPLSTLKIKPSKMAKIGLDVHVNDDDDGGDRDTKLTWSDKEDIAWQSPNVFGTVSVGILGGPSGPVGMVGWWKFDESEGWNAGDSSGNNLTGTLKGDPKWQPSGGVIGGALKLDGEDDYVEIEYKTDLPVWTIAIWAKSPEAPTSEMPTCPITREKNYQMNWDHAHDAFRGAAGVSVEGEWHAASFGDLEADIWYHLAATYDGENLKAYKNGALVDDNSDPSGNPQMEGETLKLGKNAIYDLYFKGAIDDARVYSYALNKDEIEKIYSKGKQK